MKITQFNFGVNQVAAPTLIANHAVISTNIDLSSGALAPHAGPGTVHSIATKRFSTWWPAQQKFIEDTTAVEYLAYMDKLLRFDGTQPSLLLADNSTIPLGLPEPSIAPIVTIDGSGVLTGTYQYCYTYYNNTYGIESAPSPLSNELVLANNKALIGFATPIGAVTHIRLYRIGGTWAEFVLLAEIATDTYSDNTDDYDLTGSILATQYNQPPLAAMVGVSYRQGVYFGCVGTKVYYSTGSGEPWYWPASNYVEFFEPVVGTASVGQYTYVFTNTKTYALVGLVDSLTQILLSAKIGATSINSIRTVENAVLFLSNTGLAIASGSTIQELSTGLLQPKARIAVRSAVLQNIYYALLTDDTILCANLQASSPRFTELQSTFTDIFTDGVRLMVTAANVRKQLDGAPLPFKYKTGWLTEGEVSNVKTYDKVYIYSTGNVRVKIYLDGMLATTIDCTPGLTETTVPQPMRNAYYCELELSGTGTVYEITMPNMTRQT